MSLRDLDREDAELALMQAQAMVDTLAGLPAFRDWYCGKLVERRDALARRATRKVLSQVEYAELVGEVAGLEAALGLVKAEGDVVRQAMNRRGMRRG